MATIKKVNKTTVSSEPKTARVKKISTPKQDEPTESYKESRPRILVKKSYLIIASIVLIIGAGLYLAKGFFVAALVNGQPISRLTLVQELEKQGGKQVLDQLVANTIITQEAKKRNIQISKAQIDSEMKKIEDDFKKQGQNFDQLLSLRGFSKDAYREQIQLKLTLQKILEKDISVSDKDVTEYLAKNQDPNQPASMSADVKMSAKQQLQDEKLNQKIPTWLQDQRKNAKINYFVTY